MRPNRRDILRLGLGSSTLLASGLTVPAFLARSASVLAAGSPSTGSGRILVVVQLDGGNDGLNTVVPFADDVYYKFRPKLGIDAKTVHKVDDHIGLNPALRGFVPLLESQRLAIVQSVGYPNPSRSHFESMAIWQTARRDAKDATSGWLARWLDGHPNSPGGDAPALHIGASTVPQALQGGRSHVPSLARADQLQRRVGPADPAEAAAQRQALDAVAQNGSDTSGSILPFVQRSMLDTYASSDRIEAVLKNRSASTGYPEFYGLAQRLKLIAQLIKAGLSTPLYYTQLGGFDTHSGQLNTHAALLRELSESTRAFLDDVDKAGLADRVLILAFSEFGRRVAENASAGTDHGTAAPVFLLGRAVRPGLHGTNPDLKNLRDGDPIPSLDFRRVYAAVWEGWLGGSSQAGLGGTFEPLPVLKT
jgi:uncharacterized protein (DUF1501 family)